MNKRKRILLIAVFALTICGLGLVLFLSQEPPEPTYQGKPLSYWLQGFVAPISTFPVGSLGFYWGRYWSGGHVWPYNPSARNFPAHPKWPAESEANQAIKAIGTNAIPQLLRMLQAYDSPLKLKAVALLQRQHWIHISFEPADIKNYQALAAFNALGHSASNAAPRLSKIFKNDPHPFPQQAVPAILGWIGPPAHNEIATLVRGVTHTNWIVRYNSTLAIEETRPDPTSVVPALIKLLDDPNGLVRCEAVRALGRFGSDARAAVPALLKLAANEAAHSADKTAAPSYFLEGPFVGASWQSLPFGTFPANVTTYARLTLYYIDPDAFDRAAK